MSNDIVRFPHERVKRPVLPMDCGGFGFVSQAALKDFLLAQPPQILDFGKPDFLRRIFKDEDGEFFALAAGLRDLDGEQLVDTVTKICQMPVKSAAGAELKLQLLLEPQIFGYVENWAPNQRLQLWKTLRTWIRDVRID